MLAVDLHNELASQGCAPALLAPLEQLPGSFSLVTTAYLDPGDGWIAVRGHHRG